MSRSIGDQMVKSIGLSTDISIAWKVLLGNFHDCIL